MAHRYVLLSLVTREKLMAEPYGRQILTLLYEQYPLLAPEFANFYDPINKPVPTVESALEYWKQEQFICRRKKTVRMMNGWVGSDRCEIGRITFEYSWNQKVDWFQVLQKMALVSKSYFAYVHVCGENEIEGAGLGSAVYLFLNGVLGMHLKKGIPQLGWGHYFGEEYVKELDISLLKKHGFSVEPLGEGYVFNLTDQLSDVITNYEYFNERRALLKSLFRPDLFQNYAKYEHES